MTLLKDIAEIRSGYPFRERPERLESGGCRLVQLRDVNRGMGAVLGNLETVKVPDNWEAQRLRIGDVLLAARGRTNKAAALVVELPKVIASSTLFVLRANEAAVNPHYLVWWLNLPRTQEQLRAMQAGSGIPFIPIDDLGQLPVPLPDMEQQDKIVDLELLSQEEQTIMTLVQRKRRELIDGIQQNLLSKK